MGREINRSTQSHILKRRADMVAQKMPNHENYGRLS